MVQTIAAAIAGVVCIVAGIWGWRTAARLAETSRDRQAPIYGDKLASRVYRAGNVRLGAVGGIVFGVVLASMSFFGAFQY